MRCSSEQRHEFHGSKMKLPLGQRSDEGHTSCRRLLVTHGRKEVSFIGKGFLCRMHWHTIRFMVTERK